MSAATPGDRDPAVESTEPTETGTPEAPAATAGGAGAASGTEGSGSALPGWTVLGLVIVLGLAATTRFLESWVPDIAEGTGLAGFAEAVEYPVYAILLGLLGNLVLSLVGLRDRLASAFKTEFFIKTGLVLLGSTVLFDVIIHAAGPAVLQALFLVTSVFLFAWWLGGRLGLDDRLRALLASSVSICGVSAAIAAAGAVQAKKEQLAYTASLVILFAVPSIFLLPWLVEVFGLNNAQAGAWIGGNIDTTAAVAASGAIVGEEALQIASIVKSTQNVLMGVVAVALTAYFAFKVAPAGGEGGADRPGLRTLWDRFPKFVLGFLVASVVATLWANGTGDEGQAGLDTAKALRDWFLIAAFTSIGLEFKLSSLREAGWRPIGVFAAATVFNLVVGLLLAVVLFRDFVF
ncbi:YeiH family protein [Nocardiopsis sp. MG754419]|uniref:YeiH family protein n=1 Tax=Nocardiopsis sp. MG754419 TaxID=2259865 RepID=UPI001BABECC0|nr:putative sulfate exporter family transporter [Nocardiopsis sp. MG754419]MBR8740199.1 putative sulfate exporter family transporter [Nocardiopsis sp. MG754419]